jgi:hypothetical protein
VAGVPQAARTIANAMSSAKMRSIFWRFIYSLLQK